MTFMSGRRSRPRRDKSVIAHSYPPAGQSFDSLALRVIKAPSDVFDAWEEAAAKIPEARKVWG